MEAETLRSVVGYNLSVDRAEKLINGCNQALVQAECTTKLRAAMFLAQLGEESAGFNASEEYASGQEYEGRLDLGNSQPGDGQRYKGRSAIMVTGRNNYRLLSRWAFEKKLVPTPFYFIYHPDKLAEPKYFWLGAVWYWSQNHNHGYDSINSAADAGDIVAVTMMINGGTNGLEVRRTFYKNALSQGNAILPSLDFGGTVESLRLLRAIVLGGKYATPGLSKKYPMLVRHGGVAVRIDELEQELKSLKKQNAALSARLTQSGH